MSKIKTKFNGSLLNRFSPIILHGDIVNIYIVDMSSSTKIDNREKSILILGIGPTQRLENTLSAEKNVFN